MKIGSLKISCTKGYMIETFLTSGNRVYLQVRRFKHNNQRFENGKFDSEKITSWTIESIQKYFKNTKFEKIDFPYTPLQQ